MNKLTKTILCLFLLITLTFVIINISNKNYFVNDDNLSYTLPNFLIQAKTLFTYKQIPFINYYQYLGQPLLEQGSISLFYLP